MMPARTGLVESHAHIVSYGESLGMTDLSGCRGVAECIEQVTRERARDAAWIRMLGARIAAWDDPRWPTLAELDRAAGDTPCILMSFDHHAAVANSAAIAAAGLRPGQVVPTNGLVEANGRGEATGLLIEQAAWAVWAAAPEPSMADRERHVSAALASLSALGYVEVHDMLSQPWLGPLLARLEQQGRLPLAVRLYPPIGEVEAVASTRHEWETPRVRLAGGKAFADGTINSRTALMLADYHDPSPPPPASPPSPEHPRGRAMLTDAELDGAIRLTRRLDIGLAVHAIGDGAVRMVLDAVTRAIDRGPARSMPTGQRTSSVEDTDRSEQRSVARAREFASHVRIEHAELIDPDDVPRFARLGVTCSVQPCHLLADVEALRRFLPHRLDRVLPLRSLIAAGCRPGGLLRFGSDVPIVRPDPADSIRAAVHRRREGAPQADAIAWDQRISETEAWAALGCPSGPAERNVPA